MYQAIGRAATKDKDGKITIKVEIMDDRSQRSVRVQTYTGASVNAIKAQVRADLQALVDSEQDAALNVAIVGVLLGQV